MVGPTMRVGAEGGSLKLLDYWHFIFNAYRYPYTFESTLHCQVHLRSLHGYLCAHWGVARSRVKALSLASIDNRDYVIYGASR